MSDDILSRPFGSLWTGRERTDLVRATQRAVAKAGAITVADLIEIAPDFWGATGAEIVLVLAAHGLVPEPDVLDLSPYATALCTRTKTALFQAGIYTLRALSGRSAADLLRPENKGLGQHALTEIRGMLGGYGLHLLDEDLPGPGAGAFGVSGAGKEAQ
jgi:DNA-directed RNA polymerase alpha subunit